MTAVTNPRFPANFGSSDSGRYTSGMNSINYPSYNWCALSGLGKGHKARMYDKFMHERILNLLLERRGGISFDRADKTALYVRMLGDVIVHGKLVTTDPIPIRRGSVPENEYKAPEILPSNNIRRTSLQTPTVAAIVPSTTSTSASQAKQAENDDGSDNSAKSSAAQQRTHPTVLLDAGYHGKAHHMLQKIGQWDFNIFKFDEISKGHSLKMVLFHLFEQYGLTRHFQLDSCKLLKSFELIEEAYYNKSKNPYHNSMHAADVCQAMHCYLQEEKLREALTPIEIMGALLGSAMHDLDHPGVNQKYLINSKHHLAELYQNSSVLENHHWRVGISVLTETGLLDHLPPQQWKMFVDHIRSLILATDIARQHEFLSEFQMMLERSDLSLRSHETRKFILQIALKCADICNPCRPWQITEKWGNVVSDEFFRQGDREKAEDLPISMNCNRNTTTIPQIQCGFIGFVVEPLFKTWARFMPSALSQSMLHNMRENKRVWTDRREKEQAVTAQVTAKPNSAIQSSSKESKECKAEEKARIPDGSARLEKSADVAEPETKTLKLSVEEKVSSKAMESGNVSLAGKHKQSAIRERSHMVQVHAHQEQVRPHSAVLSPLTHRALGVHRAVDVTLSDSNTMSVHSHSADNLRSASSTSAVSMRSAMEAKQRDSRSPKVNKRVKSATENMLHGGYLGSRRSDSFSLRLPRSPNTLRKELRFDDPWEKIEKSPRSPSSDLRSPVGSPPPCIESPLLQRASHPLRISHTSPGLSDSTVQRNVDTHGNNAITKLGHGLNNNLDFNMPVDLRSTSLLLHQNTSHNKQHDGSEPVHWQERGLHMYSEQNSVPQRNSKHFMKAALSPSSSHRDTSSSMLEHRTKATPTSLLVRPTEGRGAPWMSPPTSHHARTEGYSSSLLVPGDSSGKDRPREKGSPFIRKRIVENKRKKDLQVPVISSGSLSPRVPPRGMLNIYAPTSPPYDHTPTSPPYSVPAALSPLLQDFTSNQLASIARRRQHMQEGDQPSPSSSTTSMSHAPLGDRSPRLQRHRVAREMEPKSGQSTTSTHDSTDLSR